MMEVNGASNKEQGYALYLVLVVSSLLFLLVFTVTASYYVQHQLLHYRESEIRVNYLILSGLTIWMAEESGNEGVAPARTIILEDGYLTVTVEEQNGHEVILNILAEVKESRIKQFAQVALSLDNGSIIRWLDR